jgi:chemotaxis-related protein WspB
MLFLVFQIGNDRYALETSRVVEVVPLVEIQRLPNPPKGVAGLINYRGRSVPAADLSELTLKRPSAELLSTRIIIIRYPDASGANHLLGLIAEHATELLRADPEKFLSSSENLHRAPFLGPVFSDARGSIHLLHETALLPPSVQESLYKQGAWTQPPPRIQTRVIIDPEPDESGH